MDIDRWEDRRAASHARIARSHKTYEDTINILLEGSLYIPSDSSAEVQAAELSSDQYLLRKALLHLARDNCIASGLKPGTTEALRVFEDAYDVANAITDAYWLALPYRADEKLALTPKQVKEKLALIVPPYVQDLVYHVQKHGKLGPQQQELSFGVGNYVKSNFKSPDVDRLLLQALTHVEIVAFIDEMTWKNVLTGTSRLQDMAPASVLKAVWNVSRLIFFVWVTSVGIVALPLLLPALSQELMLLLGLSIAGIGTLALLFLGVLSVIQVTKEKPRKRKRQQSILDMIDRMNGFYMEFRGSGPFSLSHFKKRVNELADTGVIWPSGLFVLIEDMEERDIRSF